VKNKDFNEYKAYEVKSASLNIKLKNIDINAIQEILKTYFKVFIHINIENFSCIVEAKYVDETPPVICDINIITNENMINIIPLRTCCFTELKAISNLKEHTVQLEIVNKSKFDEETYL